MVKLYMHYILANKSSHTAVFGLNSAYVLLQGNCYLQDNRVTILDPHLRH